MGSQTDTIVREPLTQLGGDGVRLPGTYAYRKVISFPTSDLSDPATAALARDSRFPATVYKKPTTLVVDLTGKLLSPAALRELIVPLGQRVGGRVQGPVRFVVAASDPAVREMVGLLAREHRISLFLATSREHADVVNALPVGVLTEADLETLEELRTSGSVSTVSAFATALGLQTPAANNRLVNVERKEFVFRVTRGRDEGDQFVDPRVRNGTPLGSSRSPQNIPPRQALLNAGILSDPYQHPPRDVEGEAAERLTEILQRRKKRP